MKNYFFVTLLILANYAYSQKKHPNKERGIETDKELMTQKTVCDDTYKLFTMDSIAFDKKSPYGFYFKDKFKNCKFSLLVISKLKNDSINKRKYSEIFLGEHRFQKIFTDEKNTELMFEFNKFEFKILKDTILVKVIKPAANRYYLKKQIF